MARVTFDSVFIKNADGSLAPRQRIRIGGITLSPQVHFRKGVSFSGIDFTQYLGHDLEIETDKKGLIIKGIY